jgi:NAD(P)-dependent dehydrogenase (short-subunit alcohol dehydrogenase family)
VTGTLEGRSAIVTGAGRGIGRAIAQSLAAEGARVIVADVGVSISGDGADPAYARDVATAIGNKAIAFTESVASPGAARQLVDLALKTFDRIDIVVNNAAIRRDAPVFEADPADWDAVLRNNLSAPFYLTGAATAIMRRRGTAGRIVNIVSAAGLSGAAGQAAYASAKAGLIGLTRATALDLAEDRITANAVLPFDPSRVADLVTALCAPAAQDITGRLFGVRGGEIFLFGQPRGAKANDLTTLPEEEDLLV